MQQNSLTIKAQLIAAISLLAVVLALLGWLGLSSLSKALHSTHSIYEDRVVPLQQLKIVSDMYAVNIVDTAHKTRNGNLDWAQSMAHIEEAERTIQIEWNAYLATELIEQERQLAAEATPLMQHANRSVAHLKQIVAAHDQAALVEYTRHELYPAIDPITQKIALLVKVQLEVAETEYEQSNELYQHSRQIGLVAIPVSIFMASLIGLGLYRSIRLTIDRAHRYFKRMASGNLDMDIDTQGGNELAVILEAAQQLKNKLNADVVAAHALADEMTRIKVALDNVSTSVMIADNDRTLIYFNRSVRQLLSELSAGNKDAPHEADWLGRSIDGFHRAPEHQAELLAQLTDTFKTQVTVAGKIFALTANPVVDAEGIRLGSVVEWEDVTEKLALQNELEQQARKDYLTGLPNRRYFLELAEQALLRAQRYRGALSALMLDIDHFKQVNDTYGHKAGDAVLQHFAVICLQVLREVDIVGRLGGEEFAVILPETSVQLAAEAAERLRLAFAETEVKLPDAGVIRFTVSIGVSTLSEPTQTVDDILQHADGALYQAKTTSRNAVVIAGCSEKT